MEPSPEAEAVAGYAVSPSQEQVLATLERIVASEEFAGSAQLSRFLRHVVGNGLLGEAKLLKESVIGVAVFNRGPGYDPKTDPIVRVEARRLRARLEAYYQKHEAAEAVRISLPKGGYVPSFETAPRRLAVGDAIPHKTRWLSARWRVLVAVSLALAAIAVYRANAPERLVSSFWSPILDGARPVLVIPADSALVLLQNLTHQPVQLAEYLAGEYRGRLAAQSRFDPETLLNLAGRRYTSIADLEFVNRLSHRREAARLGVLTRYARDVRVEDLKGSNLIFVGARQSNPWVELYEKDATFRVRHDEPSGVVTVLNGKPGPGEPSEIRISLPEQQHEVYGIVTFHRNREGTGKVLVLAGTSVAGTEAASDFLLDDARLLPWLRQAAAHGEMRGFDILLHDRNLNGSARRADVVSFHVDR